MKSHFLLSFVKNEQLAVNTYSFYFNRPKAFTFLPGQYTNVTLTKVKREPNCRFFTISSSPTLKEFIVITTKLYDSEFKRVLHNLRPGETADFLKPSGGFILDETKNKYVFLAGGIGITPFHSMINYVVDKNLSNHITLIASFLTKNDIIFNEELEKLSQKNPNIKVIYTLSNERWSGQNGRISDVLIKKYVKDIHKPWYMIVGPPEMVIAIEDVVEDMGIPLEKIQTENFTGY